MLLVICFWNLYRYPKKPDIESGFLFPGGKLVAIYCRSRCSGSSPDDHGGPVTCNLPAHLGCLPAESGVRIPRRRY
jgi:hypothetical protein